MTASFGWARVWPAARRLASDAAARQGVWYPVVSRGESRVVLEVHGRHVDLPGDVVELRDQQPGRFTVIYRTATDPNPAIGTKGDLGRVYAVCPGCGTRVRLMGHPDEVECPRCRHEGEVAWWETG